MFPTKDNVLLKNYTAKNTSSLAEKPILKNDLSFQDDNNASHDYSANSSQFVFQNWANGGFYVDWKNAILMVPTVTTIVANYNLGAASILHFKNDSTVILDSFAVNYNGQSQIQQTKFIAPYVNCKKQLLQNSVDIESLIHTSTTTPASNFTTDATKGFLSDESNMFKQFEAVIAEKGSFMDEAEMRARGMNYFTVATNNQVVNSKHIYYYTHMIRLKDLPFFENLDIFNRGGLVEMILSFNQAKLTIAGPAAAGGDTVYTPILKGTFLPFNLRNAKAPAVAQNITIDCVVGTNAHYLKQCRVYAPLLTLSPKSNELIMNSPSKKILYTQIATKEIFKVSETFNEVLHNSVSRIRRLIIIPVLHKDSNVIGLNSMNSSFSQSPQESIPLHIKNFQVQVSGNNLFNREKQFAFEYFFDEHNGQYGNMGGTQDGFMSSLINLNNFQQNYNYYVVDLSKKLDYDDKVPVSLTISGEVTNNFTYQFLTFVEKTADVTIDLSTGSIVQPNQ